MNANQARRTDGRTHMTLLVALAMVLSALGLIAPGVAQAVTLGSLTTRMEIDGDKANAAGFDWNDIQDGTLPGGYVISAGVVSAGVAAQTYQIDGPSITESCGVQDADSLVDGSKLDDNPWPVQVGLPNSKNDICSAGAALEAVNVSGTVHYILYQYYTRTPSATGDQSVVMSLNGPLPGRCDDVLIDYNFGPSSGVVTTAYRWTPTAGDACADPLGAGSWGGSTVASALVQTATGPNPELDPATANPSTFGEFAIDLTASNVLPSDRCVTFTTGAIVTYTGNSTQASLKDILNFSNPIVLNNCGAISVSKATEPSGFGAGQNFTYKLDQTDSQPVHDNTLSVTGGGADTDASNLSITSLIQTAQTHVWSNVLAQPDYRLQEVTVPASWQVKQITCSFWDPFFVSAGVVTPQFRTVTTTTSTLAAIGIPSPQLKPAGQPNTSCTITNATSGIRLVKAGSGDADQTFSFTMTGQTVPALKLGDSADFAFAPATNVTINETLPGTTPAWQLTKAECKLPDDTVVGTVTGTQVALQTVAGQVITCTYTNDQQARIVVNKTGTGSATETFPFEQSWDGNTSAPADFTLLLGGTSNSGDIAPGTYTVSELLPANTPSWLLNSISCSDDAAGANQSTTSIANPTATITLAAGDTVTCTFTNNQQGRLVLVKNTVGADGTFSFSGPISSVPTSGNTGTVGIDVAPGTYPVAETVPAGWTLTSSSCDQGRTLPNVVIDAGQTVTCTFNNTKLGKIVVTKQTLPDGSPQQFTFDGSWSGAGTDLTLTDGQSGDSGFINPGTYSVAETAIPAGWALTSATCSDGSPITAIVVSANETVTCTFNNTKKGNIVIAKTAVGGDGVFNFTGTAGGSINTATNATDSYTLTNVLPGAYSATETALTGWDLTGLTCSDIDSTGDLGTATATINVSPGETVTCTFTNTKRGSITIDKVVVPAADTTQFGFTFNGQPFALTGSDAPYASGLVVPGTYVINEPATAGWQLTGLACVGQQASTVDIVGSTATIGLAPGENIACTYTNSQRGPVTVLKTLTDGPTIVSGNVYTVGYDLAVTSGSTINELYDLSDVLDFGTGTTIVSATLTTVDGPAPNVAGWNGVSQTQIQSQALINPATVDPNGHTYHVSVTFAVAGSMTVAARDCILSVSESGTGTLNTASVSSALGSNTSSDCGVIPNPLVSLGKTISAGPTRDAAGVWTIQYKVTVANSGDGPGQYSLNDTFGFGTGVTVTNVVVSTSPAGLSFSATNAGITTSATQLNAGDSHVYTITVTATIAVTAQTNGDCGNGGGFGNTASVTTNHSVPSASVCAPFSTITLIKTVINNDGGTLQPSDVTLTATGPATISGTAPVASAIPAGQYALSESAVPGYSTTGFDCGATVNVAAGTNVVCTIVNDDIAPSLTLVKTVVNNDGGTLQPADFSLQIGGTTVAQNVALPETAGVALNVGELQVDGYLPTGVSCTSDLGLDVNATGTAAITVTPRLAEDIVCTITNDDVRPGLTVVKNVVNDNGGNAVVGDFVLQVNGTQVTSNVLNQYLAGTALVISEVQIPGYVATGTICVSDRIESNNTLDVSTGGATVTLSPGESVQCTITNDDQAPTITVVKNVVNDDGGDAAVSDFPLFVGGTAVTSGVARAVNANQSYTISETQHGGYALTSMACADAAGEPLAIPVVPNEGDRITCTLVNDDLPIDLKLTKSDGGAEPLAGDTFTYTLTISNLGTRDADLGEPVVVTDVLPDGVLWVLPMPSNCDAAGQVVTCSVNPADMQVGESVVISLQAMIGDIAAPAIFTNKAFVTTADDLACAGVGCVPPCPSTVHVETVSGTNPSNNVDCEDTPASLLTDVKIVKSTSTPTPIVGSIATYTLTVSNLGPNTAHDLTVVDPTPAPLVLQSVSSSDFTCTSTNNNISCTRPVLLVGQVGTITVTALVPLSAAGGSSIQNTAVVSTITPETNLTNNQDSAVVVPVAVASEPPIIPPVVELPKTGIDVGMMLRWATLLMAAGAALAAATSRRRRRTI
jgi:uncharacterized repeat protein (TIGR01451 family)